MPRALPRPKIAPLAELSSRWLFRAELFMLFYVAKVNLAYDSKTTTPHEKLPLLR